MFDAPAVCPSVSVNVRSAFTPELGLTLSADTGRLGAVHVPRACRPVSDTVAEADTGRRDRSLGIERRMAAARIDVATAQTNGRYVGARDRVRAVPSDSTRDRETPNGD